MLGLQAPAPFVALSGSPIFDANTAIIGGLGVTNVTTNPTVINLVIHINAQGTGVDAPAKYGNAVLNAQIALNNLIRAGLSVNF